MEQKKCLLCQRPVSEWAMCFRGDDVCCVRCERAQMATPPGHNLSAIHVRSGMGAEDYCVCGAPWSGGE